MTIKLKIRKRKSTAPNGDCHSLELREAGIGLLTGKESNSVRPNKSGNLAYLNNPLKDAKSRCSLGGLAGVNGLNTGDDIMISTSLSTPRNKKNETSEKCNNSSLKSLRSDYKKMDDESNLTLDTSNCSVSLLSDPRMSETQRSGRRSGAGHIFMCFAPNFKNKFKNNNHEDMPLNPIPAKRMQTLTQHLADPKNNPLFLSYESSIRASTSTHEIHELMFESSKSSSHTSGTLSSTFKADGDIISMAPNEKIPPHMNMVSSIVGVEPLIMDTREAHHGLGQNELRTPFDNQETRTFEHQQQQHQNEIPEQIPFQNDEVVDLFGIPTPTKSSSSESQMDAKSLQKMLRIPYTKVKVDRATISYSLEDSGSSESSTSFDDDEHEIHEMTEEERQKVIDNIAELNKQFYARRESGLNEGLYSARKPKVKWWDDDKGTVCGTISSCLDGDFSIFNSTNSQVNIDHILKSFLSCSKPKETKKSPLHVDSNVPFGGDDDVINCMEDYDEDGISGDINCFQEVDDDEDTVDLSGGIDGFHASRSFE